MKIAMVSSTRYPTEKAYGVTIQHTCAALRKLGHETRIYSPSPNCLDASGNEVISIMKGSNATSLIGNFLDSGKFLFAFRSMILGARFKFGTRIENFDLIWMRDLYLANTLRLLGFKGYLVIEVHHIPTGMSLRILRKLSKKKTVIATLTSHHRQNLINLKIGGPICISPMGVPDEFFIAPRAKKAGISHEFGYLGKATSSGESNRLDVLIEEFLESARSDDNLHLSIVGLTERDIRFFEDILTQGIISSNSVSLIGVVPHAKVIEYLSDFYCGIVPYLDSQYNSMRFPIKLLEYAASSTHIIASDIPAHRSLLNDSQATFYDPSDPGSLSRAISFIRSNEDEIAVKISNAFVWAEKYTYEYRVHQAMSSISDLEIR